MTENQQANKIFHAVTETLELNVSGLSSLALSLRGTFVGTLVFEATIDGKNWFALLCSPIAGGAAVSSSTAVGQWQANVAGYLSVRIRSSVFTSGAPEGTLRAVVSGGSSGGGSGSSAYAEDVAHNSGDVGQFMLAVRNDGNAVLTSTDGDYSPISVDDTGSPKVYIKDGNTKVHGNVSDNDADSGEPVKVGAKYNAAAPTYASGDRSDLQSDVNGNLKTTLAGAIAGEDLVNDVLKTEQRFLPSGLLTSDTAVKSAAGFVHTVTISETDAAPTAGTIDIYDNTSASGTKLFSWTLTTAVFVPFTVILDQSFSTGLYVDFTTTADVGVSISYR